MLFSCAVRNGAMVSTKISLSLLFLHHCPDKCASPLSIQLPDLQEQKENLQRACFYLEAKPANFGAKFPHVTTPHSSNTFRTCRPSSSFPTNHYNNVPIKNAAADRTCKYFRLTFRHKLIIHRVWRARFTSLDQTPTLQLPTSAAKTEGKQIRHQKRTLRRKKLS